MRRWIWGFALFHLFLLAIMLGLKTPDIIEWFSRNDSVQFVIYENVPACVADGVYPPDICEDAVVDATELAEKLAPAYSHQTLCDATHQAKCAGPTSHPIDPSIAFYEPQMIGWLMALPDNHSVTLQPVFPGPKPGTLFSSTGSFIDSGYGRATLAKSAIKQPTRRDYIIKSLP
ncbi:MAG: DUF1190 domain-containing protein [Alphaproteobacteria bacterium]|jgi:uncharacterized protein YgiB involved in biofilm formation